MAIKPTPPKTPKARSARNMARATQIVPFYIDGDPDLVYDNGDPIYYDEDNYPDQFVVGVGALKYRGYLDYQNVYGEPIEEAVSKALYVFFTSIGNMNKKEDDAEYVPLEKNEDGFYVTPMGALKGNFQQCLADLVGFVMTQHGRIIAITGANRYEFEPVTVNDIYEHLDMKALFETTEEGWAMFLDIFDIAGLWSLGQADAAIEEENEQVEDEGNLPRKSESNENSPSPKKRTTPAR